ncbi:14965_t:CDS:2, partial [Funneliformis caledonium]
EDVINQIKDFDRYQLTAEQNSLINKLIPDEKLRERYMYYGLCEICGQPYTNGGFMIVSWCHTCPSFDNWNVKNIDVKVDVVLKHLNNSQNISEEFLQE